MHRGRGRQPQQLAAALWVDNLPFLASNFNSETLSLISLVLIWFLFFRLSESFKISHLVFCVFLRFHSVIDPDKIQLKIFFPDAVLSAWVTKITNLFSSIAKIPVCQFKCITNYEKAIKNYV